MAHDSTYSKVLRNCRSARLQGSKSNQNTFILCARDSEALGMSLSIVCRIRQTNARSVAIEATDFPVLSNETLPALGPSRRYLYTLFPWVKNPLPL